MDVASEGISEAETSPQLTEGTEEDTTSAASMSEGGSGINAMDGGSESSTEGDAVSEDESADTEEELLAAVTEAQGGPEASTTPEASEGATDNDSELAEDIAQNKQKTGEADDRLKAFDEDTKKTFKQFSRDARINASAQRTQAKLSVFQGFGQGLQGVGSAAQGTGDFVQQQYQAKAKAKAKEDEAITMQEQSVLEREKDYGKSAEENAKKMMDLYDSIAQSRDASMRTVLTI